MPDYLRPAITRELAPVLKQAGFTRSKPAHFLRADGDILHSIALIRSRYGGDNLMLAYRIGLLCDPLLDIDNQPASATSSKTEAGTPSRKKTPNRALLPSVTTASRTFCRGLPHITASPPTLPHNLTPNNAAMPMTLLTALPACATAKTRPSFAETAPISPTPPTTGK